MLRKTWVLGNVIEQQDIQKHLVIILLEFIMQKQEMQKNHMII